MIQEFEVAGGSIIGKDHLLYKKNNQDSYYWSFSEKALVGIVCDGCGSTVHSEVGSNIGARLIAEAIEKLLQELDRCNTLSEISSPAFWDCVKNDVLLRFRTLANAMGGDLFKTVNDFFLFTAIGFIITPKHSVLFAFGDGVIIQNGEMVKLPQFPDNKPPYIAYAGLVKSSFQEEDPLALNFFSRYVATKDLKSLLIGTDGVNDFLSSQDKNIPGKEELLGPISQFWEDNAYFKNSDQIRRRLALASRDFSKIDWEERRVKKEPGLLPDDTTLVVVRKIEGGEKSEGIRSWARSLFKSP